MGFRSEALARAWENKQLFLQAKSPEIMLAAGVIGFGVTVVTACRATLKLEDILEKGKEDLEKVNEFEHEEYSEKDREKDKVIIYIRTTVDVVKQYTVPILFGTASIVLLVKSHNIQSQRIAGLSAAYAAVDRAFTTYRARVVEKYGEDIDREMRYGVEKVDVVNPETGKTKVTKRVSPEDPSMYAVFFDPKSRNWGKDVESNYVFIRATQRYANDLLVARGHLFLNEVYDMLDIPRTTAGQVVGWLHVKGNTGDNFVDFGLFRDNDQVRDFMNGREGSILLDFNVDGVVHDLIDQPREAISWQNPL